MTQPADTSWGSSYRLIAADKWKAKSAAMGRSVTEGLVEYARARPGMQVLDLASGTGEPAITLAGMVGSQGHITALDLSSELLEIASDRARKRGLNNITFQEADAHALPFADKAFDLATCRFGVMFFKDVTHALRELARVLRPGARACFAAWGPFEQPYWQATMGVVLKHVGGPVIPQGGAAELWDYAQAVAAPLRSLLGRVSAEQWPAINAEVLQTLKKYSDNEGVHFKAQIVLASGKKST
jgi:ubiquinone/menaquinone biosynthesis C-methylase UbiE